MVHLSVGELIQSFENSINLLSNSLKEYTTSTFLNLDKEKKTHLVLSICRVASKIPDPTALNIKIVAKEGGISVGALYKYFGNRENMVNFTISIVREYTLAGMDYAIKELVKFPLEEALYYYCTGASHWSKEESTLAYFFYQSSYCGNIELLESLVKPVTDSFLLTLTKILEVAIFRGEIILVEDLDYCITYLHRSLIPIADAEIYKNIESYYFPQGFNKEEIRRYIKTIIRGISK